MALSQIYTAVAGQIITAARWNNEFGNIYTNGTDVAFPLTKAVSFAGWTVTYDVAGVSTITSPATTGFLFTIGSKSGTPGANGGGGTFTAFTYTDTNTAGSGTAALWTGVSIRTPTLAAANTLVTTTNAATLHVEGPPTAGVNETISGGLAIYAGGHIATSKGTDIASASSIAVVTGFTDVTGTTTIAGITKAAVVGTVFRLRFTGAGLNITYNATSMITPWARDYRTVPNEVLEFISLGSNNYLCYSLNGPPERVGVTIETGAPSVLAGYLAEDGTAVSRTTYSGLFAEIGTAFGVGDGSTTFNVPDTLGRVIINVDGAANRITSASLNGANADTLGGAGGLETHTLTTAQMPAHTHPIPTGTAAGAPSAEIATSTNSNETETTSSTGGGGAHSNTQPWITKNKYIRF